MNDFEKVIQEAAIRNKVVLHKDDPALLFASTVNLMLEELNLSLSAILDKYQIDHEHIAPTMNISHGAGGMMPSPALLRCSMRHWRLVARPPLRQ